MHHECAIAGILSKNNKNVLYKITSFFQRLQHRGQDGAGICYIKNNSFEIIKGTNLIDKVFKKIPKNTKTNIATAHTRYSTVGNVSLENTQPIKFKKNDIEIAISYNGTVFDIEKYKKILIEEGFKIEGNSDSEVILKWIFKKAKNFDFDEIANILYTDFQSAAFCIIFQFKDKLMAFKDSFSYRPLVFIETKEDYILASENCVKKNKLIKKIELKSSQGILIKKEGYEIKTFKKNEIEKKCPFELIYFANPKSKVFNINTKNMRIELGKILAKNDNIEADFVIPVMKSGYYGAKGYAKKRKIPFKTYIKNTTALRTFIEKKEKRNTRANEKYILDFNKIKDKKIIIVDDSIVRGTTSKKLIEQLKKAQAKEIHLRLTSPMIVNSCKWGVDIPDKNELLAYNLKSEDNIKKKLNIKSIKFIDQKDFFNIFNNNSWCNKCFRED